MPEEAGLLPDTTMPLVLFAGHRLLKPEDYREHAASLFYLCRPFHAVHHGVDTGQSDMGALLPVVLVRGNGVGKG